MKVLKNFNLFAEKYSLALLIFFIFAYTLVFSFLSLWKYYNFQYNAMDLGIINQVFFNSINGDFFASSIHPKSYLGDHFSPILFLFLPIYFIYQGPQTLLLIQTITLALCAWPIFLTSKKALGKNWALFFSLVWLLNPFVHNVNLFEFSFLPFAVFFIFWAFYFYHEEKFLLFAFFCLLALSAREDAALVVFMFSMISFFQKKKIKWLILPALLSIIYFISAIKIIDFFAQENSYKFFIYYSWLGQNILEIIKNIVFNPSIWLYHVINFNNLIFFLGLIMPLVFLPLLSPLYLLLGLIVFFQLIMRPEGGSETLLQTHYALLLFPAIFISAIYGLKEIIDNTENDKLIKFIRKNQQLFLLILISGIIYCFFALSPVFAVIKAISNYGIISDKAKIYREFAATIPKEAPVVADYNFLTLLSSRKNIYSLNYVFLGKQQYLAKEYPLPENAQYLILDYETLTSYHLQYGQNPFYQAQYEQAKKAWPVILADFGLIKIKDGIALYQKSQEEKIKLVELFQTEPEISNIVNAEVSPEIKLIGFNEIPGGYEIFWKIKNIPDFSQIKFILGNDEKTFPFSYGLTNISGIVKTSYWPIFKKNNQQDIADLKIQILEIGKGGIEINEIRGTKNVVDSQKIIGEIINFYKTSN